MLTHLLNEFNSIPNFILCRYTFLSNIEWASICYSEYKADWLKMRAEKEEEQKKKEEELLKGPSLYNSNTKIYYEPIWFDASYFAKYDFD